MIKMDTRELSSPEGRKIKQLLEAHNIEIELEVLEVGDYYIPPGENHDFGIVIERKEMMDLLTSAKSKRLWDQLKRLVSLENADKLVIIEGYLSATKKFTQWKPQAVTGLITSILFDFEVPLLFSPSWFWTAYYLYVLCRRYQLDERVKRIPIRIAKRGETPKDYAKILLSSLPGINVTRAEAILKRFVTPINALNRVDDWDIIPRLGKKTIKKVKEVLYARFEDEE